MLLKHDNIAILLQGYDAIYFNQVFKNILTLIAYDMYKYGSIL